ncbi:TTLL5 [Symbiodinium sp. CCMP2456]|nr:TTLL5 [Symbiodinium sp. CCMP2456]
MAGQWQEFLAQKHWEHDDNVQLQGEIRRIAQLQYNTEQTLGEQEGFTRIVQLIDDLVRRQEVDSRCCLCFKKLKLESVLRALNLDEYTQKMLLDSVNEGLHADVERDCERRNVFVHLPEGRQFQLQLPQDMEAPRIQELVAQHLGFETSQIRLVDSLRPPPDVDASLCLQVEVRAKVRNETMDYSLEMNSWPPHRLKQELIVFVQENLDMRPSPTTPDKTWGSSGALAKIVTETSELLKQPLATRGAGSVSADDKVGELYEDLLKILRDRLEKWPDTTPDELMEDHGYSNQAHHTSFASFEVTTPMGRADGRGLPPAFRIDRIHAPLVRDTFLYNGFRPTKGEDWLISWTGPRMRENVHKLMHEYQRVNHFPQSTELTRKDRLWDNFQRMSKMVGGGASFDFVPETFVLPQQLRAFKQRYLKTRGEQLWIVKPSASSQGRGIFLLRNLVELPTKESVVVSRYVEKPLLIQGLKFDLRIYVLVTSFSPLRAYIYREGQLGIHVKVSLRVSTRVSARFFQEFGVSFVFEFRALGL